MKQVLQPTFDIKKDEIEKQEQKEQIKELAIDDKFWSLLMQRLGARRDETVDNPRFIKLIFNSREESFQRIADKIIERESKKGEKIGDRDILLGRYFVKEQAIKFNRAIEEFGRDLIQCVIHELIHYAQDLLDKYPEMASQNLSQIVKKEELPWEKEAYRLMKVLEEDFRKYCSIEDYK